MMKKQFFWISVMALGILSFLFPVLSGLYHLRIEPLALYHWVVGYSFVYWPTYLIGLLAVPLAIFNLLKSHI